MQVGLMKDIDILELSKKYGRYSLIWRWKFIGLLPEIFRRQLFEKVSCASIYEYAYKFGGVTKLQVQRVLNTDRVFELNECFKLRSLLESGKVSIHKLFRVVSLIHKVTEDDLVTAVLGLLQQSLEAMVRDFRIEDGEVFPESIGANIIESEVLTIGSGHFSLKMQKLLRLQMSDQVLDSLLELKEKGIDINGVISDYLLKMQDDLSREKHLVAEQVIEDEANKIRSGKGISRHIPIKVKKILGKEFGNKCAVGGCNRDSVHIHHTARFSVTKSHNPHFLAPLCKAHHDIAHLVDTKTTKVRMNL